jgi:hypothetical protein
LQKCLFYKYRTVGASPAVIAKKEEKEEGRWLIIPSVSEMSLFFWLKYDMWDCPKVLTVIDGTKQNWDDKYI